MFQMENLNKYWFLIVVFILIIFDIYVFKGLALFRWPWFFLVLIGVGLRHFLVSTNVVKCQFLSCWTLKMFMMEFQPLHLSMASRCDPNRRIVKIDETLNYRFFCALNLAYFLNADFGAILATTHWNPKITFYVDYLLTVGL